MYRADVDRPAILHADLDAFFASVEQRDDPELRGRPVVVGAGVVLAASYEARVHGVRSAMGAAEARRLCPHAVWRPPRLDAYTAASRAVFECFSRLTPLVEPLSIDEAFLDVSGAGRLLGTPVELAVELRRLVRAEVGLPLSIGVARTKFLAKVASARAKPDGLLVVHPHRERAFLHPLPVEALWGVGPATARRLHDHGIDTVGDLAACGPGTIVSICGPAAGRHLHALAHNRDPRPVVTGRRDRSIGAQRALGTRRRQPDEIRRELLRLVEHVAARLRRADRLARTVTVRFRTTDRHLGTRRHTFHEARDDTASLAETADRLLTAFLDGPHGPGSRLARTGCSLVGVTLSGLVPADAVQLALRFPDQGRDTRPLDTCVDSVRRRWGRQAIGRAALGGRGRAAVAPARPGAVDAGGAPG